MRQGVWRKQHDEVMAMMNAELSKETTEDGKKLVQEHYHELYYDYLNKSNPFAEKEEFSMEELLAGLSELKQVRRKLRAAMQAGSLSLTTCASTGTWNRWKFLH
jgi:hypothetical protein